MDKIITEKDYPIQRLWIFKSVPRLLPGIIALILVLILLFLFSDGAMRTLFLDIAKYHTGFNILYIYLLLFAFSFISGITVPFLRRLTFHYSLEDTFLTLRQGIFSRQQRHIPYGTIQNLFVKQDLLDRILGLASLTIENASQGAGAWVVPQGGKQMEMVGFSGNKVSIPGLTTANAEILKGIILQKMKEHPIEDSQSGL